MWLRSLSGKITPEEQRRKRFNGINWSLADALSRKGEHDGSDSKEETGSSESIH